MYIRSFSLPINEEEEIIKERMAYNGGIYGYIDNTYPCGLFTDKKLGTISFSPITIFYGGNGSGKSTLLNLISQKLRLNRIAPFNSSELFESYVGRCEYTMCDDDEGFEQRAPNGSRIITSDDIFDYMLTVRTNNQDIAENIEAARDKWSDLKYGETIKFQDMDDYEALRQQILARSKSVSRRQFICRTVGNEIKLNSNGETALEYFNQKLKNDTLYCLDEPENSLSPKLQIELKRIIEEKAHYCRCQFIIATHSPFLLALCEDFTTIYDLDSCPVRVSKWWELENTKTYFQFFEDNRGLFLKQLQGEIYMDINEVREFIEKQSWIFAKTYANKAPHEYVVRGRINGTDEEFLSVINYIRKNGITMHYWGHPNKYIFVDRRQYWTMSDGDDDPTMILNRCNVDEYKYTVAWNGKNKD